MDDFSLKEVPGPILEEWLEDEDRFLLATEGRRAGK